MSLQKRNSGGNAIFDFPALQKAEKQTITRRIAGIATRSLLSIKNLPIKPSQKEFSLKCFTNSKLYTFKAPAKKTSRFQTRLRPLARLKSSDFNVKAGQLFRRPEVQIKHDQLNLQTGNQINIFPDQRLFFSNRCKTVSPKIRTVKLPRLRPETRAYPFSLISPNESDHSILYRPEKGKTGLNPIFAFDSAAVFLQPLFAPNNLKNEDARIAAIAEDFCLNYPPELIFPLNFVVKTEVQKGAFFCCSSFRLFKMNFDCSIHQARENSFVECSEIGRNLILEAQTTTLCKTGNSTPIFFTGFCGSWQISSQIFSKEFSTANPQQQKVKLEINFRNDPVFPLKPPGTLNSILERIPRSCKSFGHIFSADLSSKSGSARLKLRLKLKHAKFFHSPEKVELSPEKHQLPVSHHISRQLFLRSFRYSPAQTKLPEMKVSSARLNDIYKRQFFCRKKTPFRFQTRSHGRYSFKLMRKIVLPHLPAKPAVIPLNKQFFAGSLASKCRDPLIFSLKSGFYKDFVQLLGRPQPFYMTITDLSFTDISLPRYQRRIRPPQGIFTPVTISRGENRHTWITGLNFANLGLQSFLEPDQRKSRIKTLFSPLAINEPLNQAQKIPATGKTTRKTSWVDCFKNVVNIDSRLGYKNRIPSHAGSEILLELKPDCPPAPGSLAQRNIIPPPDWVKTVRNFNCRIRLLPYPFGFPGFSSRIFPMKLLSRNYRNAVIETKPDILLAQGYNLGFNRRIFRSKFSLKDPQQWLFPNISRSAPDFFVLPIRDPAQPIDHLIKAPDSPLSFAHSWQSATHPPLRIEAPGDSFAKDKTVPADSFFTNLKESVLKFSQPDSILSPIRIERIYRLLIKQIKLGCRNSLGLSTRIQLKSSSEQRDCFSVPEATFAKSQLFCDKFEATSPREKEIFAFFFKFPSPTLASNSFKSGYKALYRQYRFPYSPEAPGFMSARSSYFEIDDTSNLVVYAPGEEIRVSQIREQQQMEFFGTLAYSLPATPERPVSLTALHSFSLPVKHPFWQKKERKYELSCRPQKWLVAAENAKKINPVRFSLTNKDFADPSFVKDFVIDELRIPSVSYESSSKMENHFNNFSMFRPHWIILLNNFLKVRKEIDFQNISSSKTQPQTSIVQLTSHISAEYFRDASFSEDFSLSPAEIPLFFASIESSKLSLLARKYPFKLASKRESKSGQVFAKPFFSCNSCFNFTSHPCPPISHINAPKIEPDIKIFAKSEVEFTEFKMERATEKIPPANRIFGKGIRPRRSNFRQPFLPDWVDMEMQPVDLSLQRN